MTSWDAFESTFSNWKPHWFCWWLTIPASSGRSTWRLMVLGDDGGTRFASRLSFVGVRSWKLVACGPEL